MHTFFTILVLILATTGIAWADSKTITFYRDGALVQLENSTSKGSLEIPLPAGMHENSLRIKPHSGTTIQRVDIVSAKTDGKRDKELAALQEQRSRLEDRLKALDTREEIFRASAKSQSSKAPRKTKSNPDPMQSMRLGTEYAIAQLEAVYTARRKTEQDIKRIDARITELRSAGTAAESIARIQVAPRNGRVLVQYTLSKPGWSPLYDLRITPAGQADMTLFGQLPAGFSGYHVRAAAGTLAESHQLQSIHVISATRVKLADYRLTVSEARFPEGVAQPFSCVLTNGNPVYLPPGAATLYTGGEYRGTFRFEGISSGRSRAVSNTK